jgi:hypothetical protein
VHKLTIYQQHWYIVIVMQLISIVFHCVQEFHGACSTTFVNKIYTKLCAKYWKQLPQRKTSVPSLQSYYNSNHAATQIFNAIHIAMIICIYIQVHAIPVYNYDTYNTALVCINIYITLIYFYFNAVNIQEFHMVFNFCSSLRLRLVQSYQT